VPVPGGAFKPLHADSVNDIMIKNRSDFWLGFMCFSSPRSFAYRG
jgi:hypothetical protein